MVWIHGGDANAADHGAAVLVDAVAEGEYIPAGTKVRVIRKEGSRVTVERA